MNVFSTGGIFEASKVRGGRGGGRGVSEAQEARGGKGGGELRYD